jgi:hypothetical protein
LHKKSFGPEKNRPKKFRAGFFGPVIFSVQFRKGQVPFQPEKNLRIAVWTRLAVQPDPFAVIVHVPELPTKTALPDPVISPNIAFAGSTKGPDFFLIDPEMTPKKFRTEQGSDQKRFNAKNGGVRIPYRTFPGIPGIPDGKCKCGDHKEPGEIPKPGVSDKRDKKCHDIHNKVDKES